MRGYRNHSARPFSHSFRNTQPKSFDEVENSPEHSNLFAF